MIVFFPLLTDILPMLIGYFVTQVGLSAVTILCGSKIVQHLFKIRHYAKKKLFSLKGELKARQLLHSTYKMFIFSVHLQAVGLFFMIVAYGKYANDGVGSLALKTLGSTFFKSSFALLYLFNLLNNI